MGTFCWAGGVVWELCWLFEKWSEVLIKNVIFIVTCIHPRISTVFLLRPPGVDSDYEIQIQSVKLYELLFETIQHLHSAERKIKEERRKTCRVKNAYDAPFGFFFHEFIRRISRIYVHLKNYNLSSLFLSSSPEQATAVQRNLNREHIFEVFTRDFHRWSENLFVANNLLIEKINRETLQYQPKEISRVFERLET